MRKISRGIVEIVVLVFAVFALAAIGYYFVLYSGNEENSENPVTTLQEKFNPVSPTPTPFPFQELTIPYLRNREYESELGNLEYVSENDNYSTYLTSYGSDGYKVNGMLTVPKGEVPEEGWPAVVFVHGYIPPQEYQTLVNYNSYVDFLAQRRLVVFKIDLRGHAESEGEAFGAYYSSDYIIDILNAHAALKMSDFVNPKAIGLWGHSMGGNVVFRSFVVSDEISKAVIWAGAVYTYEDFGQYSIADSSYQPPPEDSPRRRYREKLGETYGAFDANSEFWQQVPGTNYLEGKVGEVQVHHALDDPVVEIGYSRNLMDILDNANIGHVLFEYPSGGHNLVGESFTQAMQRSTDFFND